ncbi:MAG: DUF4465 domain-containing protein [Crocinitomicaceae bacterium]|jgi:hypothetical protein
MKKKSMFVKNIHLVLAASLVSTVFIGCQKEEIKKVTESLDNSISVVDFEDLSVGAKGYVDSVGITNQFDSKNFIFQSVQDSYVWDGKTNYYLAKGFAISTLNDTITEGFANEFSAFAGSGGANSKIYIVGKNGAKITCPSKKPNLTSVDITNTTYAALSMKKGYNPAKKFEKGDFFKLVINGYLNGVVKNSIDVYLADFRSQNANDHFILKSWKTIDISSLSNTDSLVFNLSSSDNNNGGMLTPSYFALDNLKAKY